MGEVPLYAHGGLRRHFARVPSLEGTLVLSRVQGYLAQYEFAWKQVFTLWIVMTFSAPCFATSPCPRETERDANVMNIFMALKNAMKIADLRYLKEAIRVKAGVHAMDRDHLFRAA